MTEKNLKILRDIHGGEGDGPKHFITTYYMGCEGVKHWQKMYHVI